MWTTLIYNNYWKENSCSVEIASGVTDMSVGASEGHTLIYLEGQIVHILVTLVLCIYGRVDEKIIGLWNIEDNWEYWCWKLMTKYFPKIPVTEVPEGKRSKWASSYYSWWFFNSLKSATPPWCSFRYGNLRIDNLLRRLPRKAAGEGLSLIRDSIKTVTESGLI